MNHPLDDQRLQFYLRHRDDIQEWSAIEREVVLATREILAGSQVDLDERLAMVDPSVTTTRHDGGKYERIIARRPDWPVGVGIALEWENGVDPFGKSLPKYGVLFLNDDPAFRSAHAQIESRAISAGTFARDGFKVPGDRYWPVVRWVAKSKDWWQDPNAWTGHLVDGLIDLWPNAAPLIDEAMAGSGSALDPATMEPPGSLGNARIADEPG